MHSQHTDVPDWLCWLVGCCLQFILTLGSLVLGAYVAVRILGIDLGGMVTDEPEEFKRAGKCYACFGPYWQACL